MKKILKKLFYKIFFNLLFYSGIKLQNISIPSGIYSALESANLTESVLYSYNDVNLRWIAHQTWNYSLNFEISAENLNHEFLILTFHGLDTVAEISLNGKLLGNISNMFIRFRFDVKELLIVGENFLQIKFFSPIDAAKKLSELQAHPVPPDCPPRGYNGECHMNQLRKMQASFAWDWGLAAPSMGIWKNVEIEIYDSIMIRDITYELIEGETTWNLEVGVYVESGMKKKSFEGKNLKKF
jgi:beta-mannosidase